jgi:hypothetical protein
MNSRTASLKYSTYDNKIQDYLMFNIGVQIGICIFLASCFVLWLKYHPVYEYINPPRAHQPTINWLINFMSWMLLMT